MIFDRYEVKLKNGETVIFRPPVKEDAPHIIAYMAQANRESDFLNSYPEEWESKSVSEEEKFIEARRSDKNAYMIVCEFDGKIIGDCDIVRLSDCIKLRHRGVIGLAILKEHWGKGIATKLIEEIFRLATEMGITQVELDVYDKNERAISLYKKLGFVKVGSMPNAAVLKDGTVFGNDYMVKRLD